MTISAVIITYRSRAHRPPLRTRPMNNLFPEIVSKCFISFHYRRILFSAYQITFFYFKLLLYGNCEIVGSQEPVCLHWLAKNWMVMLVSVNLFFCIHCCVLCILLKCSPAATGIIVAAARTVFITKKAMHAYNN